MKLDIVEVGKDLIKDSPTIAVAGLTLGGISLNDWVLIMALAYGVLRLVKFILDWWKGNDGGND